MKQGGGRSIIVYDLVDIIIRIHTHAGKRVYTLHSILVLVLILTLVLYTLTFHVMYYFITK